MVIPPRIQDVINITATSFMVIWSPASISGQPGAPFSYTLFVNGKGYNVGSALGLNVVGLTPSTTYTVSVMALNPQIGSIPGGNSAIVKTLCGIPSTIDISTDYTKQTNVSNVTVEAESHIRFINGFRFKAATNSRLITKFSSCPKSASLELDRLLPEGDFILKDTVDTLPIQRSIEEYSSETIVTLLDNIKLSPLPVKNMLSVSLGGSMERINRLEIYNITGQLIRKNIIRNNIETFDLGNQPNGIYILRIVYKDNTIESKKFILSK